MKHILFFASYEVVVTGFFFFQHYCRSPSPTVTASWHVVLQAFALGGSPSNRPFKYQFARSLLPCFPDLCQRIKCGWIGQSVHLVRIVRSRKVNASTTCMAICFRPRLNFEKVLFLPVGLVGQIKTCRRAMVTICSVVGCISIWSSAKLHELAQAHASGWSESLSY